MIFMPSADEAKIVRGKDGELRLENFYTPLAETEKGNLAEIITVENT